MKIREFMNTYSRYGKVDIPNICEQCVNLNIERFIKLNERKEDKKMEQCIKIIIRKDCERNSNTYSKYVLTLTNQQDEVIFKDYFKIDHNIVLVYLSEHMSRILNVYSFDDYIELLKSYGITHKIEKMLSEEEIRDNYEELRTLLFRTDPISHDYLYTQGWVKALEYVLGIDNE